MQDVLRHVEGLNPRWVTPQAKVSCLPLGDFRVDFAIEPPGCDSVAIEVDGYEKSPSETYTSRAAHVSASRRENSLKEHDWHVVRFANVDVITDPRECRHTLERLLRKVQSRPAAETIHAPMSSVPTRVRSPGGESTKQAARYPSLPVLLVALGAVVVVAFLMLPSPGMNLYGSWFGASSGVASSGQNCPSTYPIKANQSQSGESIYHEPGWRYYDATWPERCFADSADAEAAGFRASEVH